MVRLGAGSVCGAAPDRGSEDADDPAASWDDPEVRCDSELDAESLDRRTPPPGMSLCEVAPEIRVDRPAAEERLGAELRAGGRDDMGGEYTDGAPAEGAGRVRVGMMSASVGRSRVDRVMRLVAAR